jgi:hypothetical protein
MDKKAQGLPISTIILAVLGLVVLVILFAIVTGRMAIFGRATAECPGTCTGTYTDDTGLTGAVPERDCDASFEKELFGTYVQAGQQPGQKAGAIVKCKKCCVPLA